MKCIKQPHAWHTRKSNKRPYHRAEKKEKQEKPFQCSRRTRTKSRFADMDRRKPTQDFSFERIFSCFFRVQMSGFHDLLKKIHLPH
jgi:hypothetical protein